MRPGFWHIALPTLLALLPACGDENGTESNDAATPSGSGPFLPWKQGNTWTYRVTNNGEVSTKVVTIGAQERVGGSGPNADKMAFKVVTKKGQSDETVSWQALTGDDVVVRYREQSFHAATGELELEEHWDPYKLHFDGTDEHTAEGASWLEIYQETKTPADGPAETQSERDRWMVDSPEEEVTVPAGTFKAVVVVKAGGTDLKTYWYVRGVGKVKETGGQTEELVEYEVSE
jgi:hypothetical protein